jgi:hypothetical protein
MKVDVILIICWWIPRIVRQSPQGRKIRVPSRVKVGVTGASVRSPMANAEIDEMH